VYLPVPLPRPLIRLERVSEHVLKCPGRAELELEHYCARAGRPHREGTRPGRVCSRFATPWAPGGACESSREVVVVPGCCLASIHSAVREVGGPSVCKSSTIESTGR